MSSCPDKGAVVFDLDGTLVDTAADFLWVINRMRESRCMPPILRSAIEQQASNGSRAMILAAFQLPENSDELPGMIDEFLELYSQHLAVESKAYPGIEECIASLVSADILWGVATNKPKRFTEPLLSKLNLKPACTICPEDVTHRKPHPESITLAAQLLSVKVGDIFFVGDHLRDIECGIAAGAKTVAAAYGYIEENSPADSWGADYLIHSADEILPIIYPQETIVCPR